MGYEGRTAWALVIPNMHGQRRKIDHSRVRALKRRGLTNAQIAQRLGVTPGAIYHVLRQAEDPGSERKRAPR